MDVPPTSPLAIGGESALGCDVLEDRQFELEFLGATSPHLCAMLLAPEGDPDTLDIPNPRTYAEAAPREWHDTLRSTLSDLGFHPSYADPSLFVRRGSTPFFVLVYVDDLVFATADKVALADVKCELQKRHTCTDLGELHHYLGPQITRDRAARTITLSLSHMVQQVLQRFELQRSTVQCTPLAVDHRLTGTFPDEPFEPSGPYAELVGCLIDDIVTLPTGHCDSSYADDAETHRSTQGYCFSLGSGDVSRRSTCSSSVSTSTTEAEIYAGAMAAQELRWLTFLLTDLGERLSFAQTLFTDNKASILLCQEPRLESRVKHINVS
ncbi:unnamed protein product [Closterium sp. NIES-53]